MTTIRAKELEKQVLEIISKNNDRDMLIEEIQKNTPFYAIIYKEDDDSDILSLLYTGYEPSSNDLDNFLNLNQPGLNSDVQIGLDILDDCGISISQMLLDSYAEN